MNFSEYVDAILYKLYESDRNGETGLVSIDGIGRTIKDNTNPMWAFDAGKVLRSRGLALQRYVRSTGRLMHGNTSNRHGGL